MCFSEIIRDAGPGVQQLVHRMLSKNGIQDSDISQRLDDIEKLLVEMFGVGGKMMIVATLSKLCEEYSLDLDLVYGNSLLIRLNQLKDRIIVDKLTPKHYRKIVDTTSFEDKTGTAAAWTD